MSDLEMISPEVDQLIQEQIESVEKLEVLLLLSQTPHQWWSAADAAKVLYRQSESIKAHLVALHDAGLFRKHEGEIAIFRYDPDSEALNRNVQAIERAYRERKDTVIRLIFAPLTNPL